MTIMERWLKKELGTRRSYKVLREDNSEIYAALSPKPNFINIIWIHTMHLAQ